MKQRWQPTTQRLPIEYALQPFQRFARNEASSGILLLLATVIALLWANSPWSAGYFELLQMPVTFAAGSFELSKPLLLWIDEGLMAVFFLLVGLEIKRELLVGELSSPRQAALPILAAVGGMVAPALIYLSLNPVGSTSRGWGVPMATDIAFALGILALLGRRVPLCLKVFLTAVAIVDDIGAVLVIALFYSAQLHGAALALACVIFLTLLLINVLGIQHPMVYVLLGCGLWLALLESGLHATIAGVLTALAVPARARMEPQEFVVQCRSILDDFEAACRDGSSILTNQCQQEALQALETASEHVETPLQRLEHTLLPWVTFFIMPVFALANAGVPFRGNLAAGLTSSVGLGVIAGLVLGKQAGIMLFSWLGTRLRFADLPRGATWLQFYGVAWLAGIGFTMALFIAGLAFGEQGSALATVKVAILAASLIAGGGGWAILRRTCPLPTNRKQARAGAPAHDESLASRLPTAGSRNGSYCSPGERGG